MFISYEEKKKIKQDLVDIFDKIIRLEHRLVNLETDAMKNGYRMIDGKPKKLPGRPRKEVAK